MDRTALIAAFALVSALSASAGAAAEPASSAPVHTRYYPARQCFCTLWWSDWTAVTDAKIAEEKAGAADGPETWQLELNILESGGTTDLFVPDHPDYYAAYIVQKRQAAGLPDLPDHPYAKYASVVIPPPKPDVITASPTAVEWARRLCFATKGDPVAARAAAEQAGWRRWRAGPSMGMVIDLRELALATDIGRSPGGLGTQSCAIVDDAPDPQESNLATLQSEFGRPPSDMGFQYASWTFVDAPEGRRFLARGDNPAQEALHAGAPAVTITWEISAETPEISYVRYYARSESGPPSPPAAPEPSESWPNLQIEALRRLCFDTHGNPTKALALADQAGWSGPDLHFTRDAPDEAFDRRQPTTVGTTTPRDYLRQTTLGAQWLTLSVAETSTAVNGQPAFWENCAVIDFTHRLPNIVAPPLDLKAALQSYFGRPPVTDDQDIATWIFEDRADGPHYISGYSTLGDVAIVVVRAQAKDGMAVITYRRLEPAGGDPP